MNFSPSWFLIALLPGLLLLATNHGAAQTRTNDPNAQVEPPTKPADPTPVPETKIEPRTGRVLVEEPKQTVGSGFVRPELPQRDLPPEVDLKLKEFRIQRERYLQQREQLLKEARGATEAEREKLRARFKQLQENWERYSTSVRENFDSQKARLQEKLQDHKRLLEDRRRTAERTRGPRKGIDE